jgi:hypothetical protein
MITSVKAAILSKDSSLTSVVQEVTSKLDIQLLEMQDVLRYIDLVSQEPFDLLLLDCEGLPAAKHLITTLRQSSANREAVFMIAGAADGPSAMIGFGTNVILSKPLTPEQAERCLRDAMTVMQERHRHYARYPLEMDVLLACPAQKWQLSARSIALGEGGIGLQLPQKIELGIQDVVGISFQLPQSHDKFELSANLAWTNNDMQAGFRFKPLTTSNSAKLSSWLNQHAPPLPGDPRKEIVESWLAKHGSATDTVVISAGLRNQILPEKKAIADPLAMEAAVISTQAPERQKYRPSARTILLIVCIFLLGIAAGFALSRLYHWF